MEDLFKEFSPSTAENWKQQIIKDLKGADYEKLVWNNPNSFDIKPFYTSEDVKEKAQPLFSHAGWDICEEIGVENENQANADALKALQVGASGLCFRLHKKVNAKELLKDISLEHIYTQFDISFDALGLLDDLKNEYGKINPHDQQQKCFINLDPVYLFSHYGEWHENREKDLAVLKRLKHIPVYAAHYHNAGANAVSELAFTIAHLNEYLNALLPSSEGSGVGSPSQEGSIHITLATGSSFFTELAKLRALRKLISLLASSYNIKLQLHIHCVTSSLNLAAADAYNNMLRTTTGGMSAVIGGCNSLSISPYNKSFEKPSDFSRRIARNQQIIFREESYLGKVADMGAGSYYIEHLTDELASKAWEEFKEIEKKGGFIDSLLKGEIQNTIKQQADELIRRFREEQLVLVGVNKFQNKSESLAKNEERTGSSKQKTEGNLIEPICSIRLSDYVIKENA